MRGRIGACSWSLQPSTPDQLIEALTDLRVECVQLALDPLRRADWDGASLVHRLRRAGIAIASGMMATAGEDYSTLESIRETGGVRPDGHWEANRAAAADHAAFCAAHGIELVTMHAGFLPESSRDPLYRVMLDRLSALADLFGEAGVDLAFETGQETAETLLSVLAALDRSNVGVNFDPANMILYGMGDPVAAFQTLLPHVRQVHVKDACPPTTPGAWGMEVPVGDGAVDWESFFALVHDAPRALDLLVEREAGDQRRADIATAIRVILARSGVTRD